MAKKGNKQKDRNPAWGSKNDIPVCLWDPEKFGPRKEGVPKEASLTKAMPRSIIHVVALLLAKVPELPLLDADEHNHPHPFPGQKPEKRCWKAKRCAQTPLTPCCWFDSARELCERVRDSEKKISETFWGGRSSGLKEGR